MRHPRGVNPHAKPIAVGTLTDTEKIFSLSHGSDSETAGNGSNNPNGPDDQEAQNGLRKQVILDRFDAYLEREGFPPRGSS